MGTISAVLAIRVYFQLRLQLPYYTHIRLYIPAGKQSSKEETAEQWGIAMKKKMTTMIM